MKIAIAQTVPAKGDIEKNIEQHLKLISNAADKKMNLIFFPELSLSGYEPELAENLAITTDDERLNVFKELSALHNLFIAVGAPIKKGSTVLIGTILFYPDGEVKLYTKQHLHPGEEKYFSTEINPLQLSINGETINFAICADISNPMHPKDAFENECTIYLASVLISKNGLKYDCELLSSYAQKYGMTVMMSNFGGISGGYYSGGHSAIWSDKGLLENVISNESQGLLLAESVNGKWITELVQ